MVWPISYLQRYGTLWVLQYAGKEYWSCFVWSPTQGIPIIYYGTEQAFHGGNDPQDRESLWPNYNTSSDLYKFISILANFRTQQGSSLYESSQIERYVDDQFFAFTRGTVSALQRMKCVPHSFILALFPAPTQLSVACSINFFLFACGESLGTRLALSNSTQCCFLH